MESSGVGIGITHRPHDTARIDEKIRKNGVDQAGSRLLPLPRPQLRDETIVFGWFTTAKSTGWYEVI